MVNSFTVQGSVALVTGANRKNGIGRAIVDALVQNGAAKVYATARDVKQFEDNDLPETVVPVSLDLADRAAVAALPTLYPDVTLLVNNAGYMAAQTSLDDLDKARQEMEVNYFAPMALVKAYSGLFKKSDKETAIVNINSIASFFSSPFSGATYAASKAAAHSLTQAQRRELPHTLVMGVYPGPIATDMADNIPFQATPPSDVATTIVDALEKGSTDLLPDKRSQELFAEYMADPVAFQNRMGQLETKE